MGVLDKIKNALFEVEYVEVDEPPKKDKKPSFKEKFGDKKEKTSDDPIAKKIVLPGKKNKPEHLEDDLRNQFDKSDKRVADEIADEIVQMEVEEKHDKFKIMDDNDFKVDDDFPKQEEVPVATPTVFEKAEGRRTRREDYYESNNIDSLEVEEKKETPVVQKQSYDNSTHNTYKEKDSKLYGVDNSYSVPVHEYGTYEKKEEKTYFKPSPIISPIYGILDKNYRKEDVVQKKEIRLTTNYTRSNVSVDDIRNKAYGDKKKGVQEEVPETKFEVEDDGEDDNLLVDLSDRAKPEVKELTVGDAVEYFQDLGLEYNVDYVDVSKTNNKPVADKPEVIEKKEVKLEIKEEKVDRTEEKPVIHSHVAPSDINIVEEEMDNITYDEPKMTTTIEVKDESKESNVSNNIDDDDNLFDLIDSMYQENE